SNVHEEDNDEPKETKAFDLEQIIQNIEKERTEMYFPVIDENVFSAKREYSYNVQQDYFYVSTEYDLDENEDEYFSTTVYLRAHKVQSETMFKEVKNYVMHLLKKILTASEKININGFS